MRACKKKSDKVLEVLLKYFKDCNKYTDKKRVIEMKFGQKPHYKHLKFSDEATFDHVKAFLKHQNNKKETAFDLACEAGNPSLLFLIIDESGDDFRKNVNKNNNLKKWIGAYTRNPDDFLQFCKYIAEDCKRFHLFSYLPQFLESFTIPISTIQSCHEVLLSGFHDCKDDGEADKHLIPCLIYYAVALQACIQGHPREAKEIEPYLKSVEALLTEAMKSRQMSKDSNVLVALGAHIDETGSRKKTLPETLRAKIFTSPDSALYQYIKYGLTSMLETVQLQYLMLSTFTSTSKPRTFDPLKIENDVYEVGTKYDNISRIFRNCPSSVFFVEFLIKCALFFLLFNISRHDSNSSKIILVGLVGLFVLSRMIYALPDYIDILNFTWQGWYPKQMYCSKHANEKLHISCRSCHLRVCSICASSDHLHHNLHCCKHPLEQIKYFCNTCSLRLCQCCVSEESSSRVDLNKICAEDPEHQCTKRPNLFCYHCASGSCIVCSTSKHTISTTQRSAAGLNVIVTYNPGDEVNPDLMDTVAAIGPTGLDGTADTAVQKGPGRYWQIFAEWFRIVMEDIPVYTYLCNYFGRKLLLDKNEEQKSATKSNIYQLIDYYSLCLLIVWLILYLVREDWSKNVICYCIIFTCLSILKYASFNPKLGPLLIMLFEVVGHIKWMVGLYVIFVIIFTVSFWGRGTHDLSEKEDLQSICTELQGSYEATIHALSVVNFTNSSFHDNFSTILEKCQNLYPCIDDTCTSKSFSPSGGGGWWNTLVNLININGNVALDRFTYFFLATLQAVDFKHTTDTDVMIFYGFITVVLLNLVLARLSSTHDEITSNAEGSRALLCAQILQEYLTVETRVPFNMLPPPLNLFTSWSYMVELRHIYQINDQEKKKEANVKAIEKAKKLSDAIMSLFCIGHFSWSEVNRIIHLKKAEGFDYTSNGPFSIYKDALKIFIKTFINLFLGVMRVFAEFFYSSTFGFFWVTLEQNKLLKEKNNAEEKKKEENPTSTTSNEFQSQTSGTEIDDDTKVISRKTSLASSESDDSPRCEGSGHAMLRAESFFLTLNNVKQDVVKYQTSDTDRHGVIHVQMIRAKVLEKNATRLFEGKKRNIFFRISYCGKSQQTTPTEGIKRGNDEYVYFDIHKTFYFYIPTVKSGTSDESLYFMKFEAVDNYSDFENEFPDVLVAEHENNKKEDATTTTAATTLSGEDTRPWIANGRCDRGDKNPILLKDTSKKSEGSNPAVVRLEISVRRVNYSDIKPKDRLELEDSKRVLFSKEDCKKIINSDSDMKNWIQERSKLKQADVPDLLNFAESD